MLHTTLTHYLKLFIALINFKSCREINLERKWSTLDMQTKFLDTVAIKCLPLFINHVCIYLVANKLFYRLVLALNISAEDKRVCGLEIKQELSKKEEKRKKSLFVG